MRKSILIAAAAAVIACPHVARGDTFPIKVFGHGIACTRKACVFSFPYKTDSFNIQEWHCKPEDAANGCKSAIYIDLKGKFRDMKTFVVMNPDQSHFFYGAYIGSGDYVSKITGKKVHYRRFYVEFRTAKIPPITWDFSKNAFEIAYRGKLPRQGAKKTRKTAEISKTHPFAGVEVRPKLNEKIEKAARELKKALSVNSRDNVSVAEKLKATAAAARKAKEKPEKTSAAEAKISENGKILLNIPDAVKAAREKSERNGGKENKNPHPVKLMTYEQMGDAMLKSKNPVSAIWWYRIALKYVKDKTSRARIADKIKAAENMEKKGD